jgi:DNA-binding PadR family transcriptional regulator
LTEHGLLAVDREEAVAGRLRRYYRLTDDGAALDAEVARMRRNATLGARQLRTRPRAAS